MIRFRKFRPVKREAVSKCLPEPTCLTLLLAQKLCHLAALPWRRHRRVSNDVFPRSLHRTSTRFARTRLRDATEHIPALDGRKLSCKNVIEQFQLIGAEKFKSFICPGTAASKSFFPHERYDLRVSVDIWARPERWH